MSKREMYIKITPDLLSEIHDILKENSTNISDEAYKYIDYLERATEPVYYMGFHWHDNALQRPPARGEHAGCVHHRQWQIRVG